MGVAEAIEYLGSLLAAQNDPETLAWRRLSEAEQEAAVQELMRTSEAEDAERYRVWFPRLQAFAADCRRASPTLPLSEMSIAEREQHRICLGMMRKFAESQERSALLEQRPNRAAILSATRIGLTAMEEVFGNSGGVILEESEVRQWFSEVYPRDDEAHRWYANAWWRICQNPPEADVRGYRESHPIPKGDAYWVVTEGVQCGNLGGGATHYLWQWDGTQAEFIECHCIDSFL
ncbi:MAG: hypothetical protein ACKV0T_11280 [Planctomycetales bacterium]